MSELGEHNGPFVLIIRDGWGESSTITGNAVKEAATPTDDATVANWPTCLLTTCGEDVGLPPGQMGNSEVGHLNLGAGRIVYQDLLRITRAMKDGSVFTNKHMVESLRKVEAKHGKVHLIGLCSDGGVHSHIDHIVALLEFLSKTAVESVCLHCVMDGRDTSPTSGLGFLEKLSAACAELKGCRIATVSGRYYAMDRDNRWERVAKAFEVIVHGSSTTVPDACAYLQESYKAGTTDEFILPVAVGDYGNKATAMTGDDLVVFCNFRADRMRQIVKAMTVRDFNSFDRKMDFIPAAISMTEYESTLDIPVLFEAERPQNTLGEVLSGRGIKQVRIAETEKYAHVTYFFNGGAETPFAGEDRQLVPSPKVATYDLQPEMSAAKVADLVVDAIASKRYGFVLVNFANADMVGHTGVFEAAVKAVETVDGCVGRILTALKPAGGCAFITADHGNSEQMIDEATGEVFTAHTLNQVHLSVVDYRKAAARFVLSDGKLADVAPTILQMMGIAIPAGMTGQVLVAAKP